MTEISFRLIPLTKGMWAIVDASDYEFLMQWKWRVRKEHNTWYAYRRQRIGSRKRKDVRMHRLILDAPEGVDVDHDNGNGLDNRRSNIRLATEAQNQHNQTNLRSDNTNGYKGVFLDRSTGKYRAQIQVGKKHVSAGNCATPEEAALVYDRLALEHFGEFAHTNAEIKEKRKNNLPAL